MAEHELVKHTKKAFTIWSKPKTKWMHKLGEFLLEIFIIVFAISLSFYLERNRENGHDRKLEKEFLLGLRTDLTNDITELSDDSSFYEHLQRGFTYFLNVGSHKTPYTADSIRFYNNTLYSSVNLIPNNSRFEGLKASGKLQVIHDHQLLDDILNLYQEKIPLLLVQTTVFSQGKRERIETFLETNLRSDTTGKSNFQQLLENSSLQNSLRFRRNVGNIINQYGDVLAHSRSIIDKIDKLYGKQ